MVPLNSYDLNNLTLDASCLPLNAELSNPSQQVAPRMPFEVMKVHRYQQHYLCEPVYNMIGRLKAVELSTEFTGPDGRGHGLTWKIFSRRNING